MFYAYVILTKKNIILLYKIINWRLKWVKLLKQETVCLIFLDEILSSKVKRKIEPSNGQKCHDSDLKSPRYHKISSRSPRGHFYGLSWPTWRYPRECLPWICPQTRWWLKETLNLPQASERDVVRFKFQKSIFACPITIISGAGRGFRIVLGPPCTDSWSYGGVLRLLVHNGVTFPPRTDTFGSQNYPRVSS